MLFRKSLLCFLAPVALNNDTCCSQDLELQSQPLHTSVDLSLSRVPATTQQSQQVQAERKEGESEGKEEEGMTGESGGKEEEKMAGEGGRKEEGGTAEESEEKEEDGAAREGERKEEEGISDGGISEGKSEKAPSPVEGSGDGRGSDAGSTKSDGKHSDSVQEEVKVCTQLGSQNQSNLSFEKYSGTVGSQMATA